MYKRIHIQNFKNFKDLELTDLKRVNLIAGKNASGKSALLEAIFLHSGAYNPGIFAAIYEMRGQKLFLTEFLNAGTPWDSFFSYFNTSDPIYIAAENDKYGNLKISAQILNSEDLHKRGDFITLQPEQQAFLRSNYAIELTSSNYNGELKSIAMLGPGGYKQSPVLPPPFQTVFITPRTAGDSDDARRFDMLVAKGDDHLVVKNIRIFEPRVKRVASITVGQDTKTLYADVGLKEMIPLSFVSDGIARIVTFIISITLARSGVVIIDEIENGLHYSILEKVWKTIARVARNFDVQVFA
ncbi:MAG: hypothetical protein FJY65_10150, partial [Calditrichaeota bacterium]|nr:hypothetical protein [Calditrichota bacterium]